MSQVLASLIAALLFSSETVGKTVTGMFNSELARQQNGQFITTFMYQGNVNDADVSECVILVVTVSGDNLNSAFWKFALVMPCFYFASPNICRTAC